MEDSDTGWEEEAGEKRGERRSKERERMRNGEMRNEG